MNILDALKTDVIAADVLNSKRVKISQGLNEFPRELFSLADHLEILDLGGNQLSDLPDDFHRFKNLKILFLTDNLFTHIPSVLAQCKTLEMIAFKSNQVKTVAENCLPLSTNWLILTNNQIETLPDSMGQLSQLRKLALAGNQLTSLPDTMANCRGLELVRLSANQLTRVPDWLLELPKLSWLGFSGNPVCESSSSPTTQIPQVRFNAVRLNHQIGEGASGVIHHASWVKEDHSAEVTSPIAVKVFKGSVTSDGYPQDEIQCCLKAGEHPNLIKVLSHIDDSEQLGLVMELISTNFENLGLPPSLASCTRDTFEAHRAFHSNDVLMIVRQMADTLSHMHQQEVSHGDIYAHNTMIDSNANILFGDFGAATNLDALSAEQKQKMQLIEVRAFGCFLDDLLGLVEVQDSLFTSLANIRDSVMSENIVVRPDFSQVCSQLFEL